MLLLGEATFLFMNSPLHLRYAVHQLPTFILTPLRLAQYRMYRSPSGPVGFVAWAWLTPETARAYARQQRDLEPADWNAGDELWFIEFVAPFGHAARIVHDLRTTVFPHATALSLRRFDGNRPAEVVTWRGASVRAGPGVAESRRDGAQSQESRG